MAVPVAAQVLRQCCHAAEGQALLQALAAVQPVATTINLPVGQLSSLRALGALGHGGGAAARQRGSMQPPTTFRAPVVRRPGCGSRKGSG